MHLRTTLKSRIFLSAAAVFTIGTLQGCGGEDEAIAPDRGGDSGTPSETDDSPSSPVPTGTVPTVRPTTSVPTAMPTTPVPTTAPIVGAACEQDSDCADGLFCMTSDSDQWLGGGPANGYCTLDCAADMAACGQVDPTAACLGFASGEAYCMQACLGADNNPKCFDRADLACDAFSATDPESTTLIGFCRPTCRNDDDCDGRVCDLGSGACVDEVAGDPIGAACDPDAEESDCASGLCLGGTEEGFGTCSGLCNLSQFGCGLESTDGPGEPGAPICFWPVAESFGSWDLGLCTQTCACDEQCSHPDAVCLLWSEDEQELAGFPGLCMRPGFADDNELPEGATFGRACPAEPDAGPTAPGRDAGPLDPAEAGPSAGGAPGLDAAPGPVQDAQPTDPVPTEEDASEPSDSSVE